MYGMAFDPLREFGRLLIFFGSTLVLLGLLLALAPRLAGRLGRLPGDFIVRGENYTLYFPLATCLLLGVILSLLFRLFLRR